MSLRYQGSIISATPPTTSTSSASGAWTLEQEMRQFAGGTWPRLPGAPTIGTATATSSSTATVAFTAPTDLGSGSITYTATSSPGGLTGTGTSPITVSGLTGSTSYTFTVAATTPAGVGPSSAASNSITTLAAPWISIQTSTTPTTNSTQNYGVGADSSGNMYSALNLAGSGQTLQKFSTAGASQFAYKAGTTLDRPVALYVDSSNNVYVLARTNGTQYNILTYNTSGTITSQKYINNGDGLDLTSITVRTDNVIVVGGTITVGSTSYAYTGYYSSGIYTQNKHTSNWFLNQIAQGESATTYNCGYAPGSVPYIHKLGSGTPASTVWGFTLNSGNIMECVYREPYNGYVYGLVSVNADSSSTLVRFNPADGSIVWSRNITNFYVPGGRSNCITVDTGGNIYVVGTSPSTGASLYKFNSSGTLQFQRRLTVSPVGGNAPRFRSVVWDASSSNLMIGGYFDNSSNQGVSMTMILPSDGSKTGTYTVGSFTFTYAASSQTISTVTYTASSSPPSQSSAAASEGNTAFTNTSPTVTTTTTSL